MATPIIITPVPTPPTPTPPTKPKKIEMVEDAWLWAHKWSTWLAVLSASAAAGLAAYAIMPLRVQNLMPDWALATLGGVAIVSALLVPLATSVKQKKLVARVESGE
jgi:hypothetical protein